MAQRFCNLLRHPRQKSSPTPLRSVSALDPSGPGAGAEADTGAAAASEPPSPQPPSPQRSAPSSASGSDRRRVRWCDSLDLDDELGTCDSLNFVVDPNKRSTGAFARESPDVGIAAKPASSFERASFGIGDYSERLVVLRRSALPPLLAIPAVPAGMGPNFGALTLALSPGQRHTGHLSRISRAAAAAAICAVRGYSSGLPRIDPVQQLLAAVRESVDDVTGDPTAVAGAAASLISSFPGGGALPAPALLAAAAGVGAVYAHSAANAVVSGCRNARGSVDEGCIVGGDDDSDEEEAEAQSGAGTTGGGAQPSQESFAVKVAHLIADCVVGRRSPSSARHALRRRMRTMAAGASLAWTAVNVGSLCLALASGPEAVLDGDLLHGAHALLDVCGNLPNLGEVMSDLVHLGTAVGLTVDAVSGRLPTASSSGVP